MRDDMMRDSAVITVPSHPRYLAVIRAVTGKMGELCEIDENTTEDIKLAVDEACTNVIKHAYRGDVSRKIVIKYKITRKAFRVAIEDNGIRAHEDVLKGRNLNTIRPGGLGIHLIKRVFDVLAFDEKKKTGNRLILVKYLKGEK